jgi:hypothetical protein
VACRAVSEPDWRVLFVAGADLGVEAGLKEDPGFELLSQFAVHRQKGTEVQSVPGAAMWN